MGLSDGVSEGQPTPVPAPGEQLCAQGEDRLRSRLVPVRVGAFAARRHDPDLTPWLSYFVEIMALAARRVSDRALELHEAMPPPRALWEELNRRQQQLLSRLVLAEAEGEEAPTFTPGDIAEWFMVSTQTARSWLQEWHEASFHDLCAEGFDALLPPGEADRDAALPPAVAAYRGEIASGDGIVIVHPNWWGRPPAILKGWIDRVLRVGVAYKFEEGDSGEGLPLGLLRAKAAVVLNTSNTPAEREQRVFGDPLQALWRDCIFSLCGVEVFEGRMFGVVVTSTLQERLSWLEEVRRILSRHFPPCRR